MNSIPRDLKVSRALRTWETDLANRSNFHTTMTSKRRLCASAMRRSSSGRRSFVPEMPMSMYAPVRSQPRRAQYSRSSEFASLGLGPQWWTRVCKWRLAFSFRL